MPLTALSLVILAGLIHASWNIAAKKSGGDLRFIAFSSLVILVVWMPVGVGAGWNVVPHWGWHEWACIVASAVLHVLYFSALLRGYREADLTVVYPIARGSGPLLSSAAAILWLGEPLGWMTGLGVLCMVLGVFLIAGGPSMWQAGRDPASAQRVHRGLYYGAITGLFIACYTVVDGVAVKRFDMSPILVDYMGNLMRLLLVLPLLLRDRTATVALWRQQWRPAVWVGVFSPVSYVLVLYALQMAPLSHVAPAREISMLFAALLGGRLLGESHRGLRILGALSMVCGVMALAWS